MTNWRADVANDPHDDYNLVVEISYGDTHRASIVKRDGELVVRWYADESDVEIPADWLCEVLSKAKRELGSLGD